MAFIVGVVVLAVSIAVMAVVGVWAAQLPPANPWLCLDECSVDIARDQRGHYYWVTVGAIAAVLLAWLIMTLSIPSGAHRLPRAHRLAGASLALGAVMTVGALGALQSISLPTAAAMWALGSTSLLLGGWSLVRQWDTSDRAAVMVSAFFLALGHGIGLYPAVAVVAWASEMLTAPGREGPHTVVVLGIPLTLASACALTGIWEMRRYGPPPARPRSVTPRDRAALLLLTGVIVFVGILAAWPLPAPPWDEPSTLLAASPELVDEPVSRPLPAAPSPTTPSPSPPPGPEASAWRACTKADLRVEASGWDSVSGKSSGSLNAENVGTTDCALRGTPGLQIIQGGDPIDLRVEPLTSVPTAAQQPGGVGLRPGEVATAILFWPGYRTAADYTTPQQAFLVLEPEGGTADEPVPVGLLEESAPFDLKDGVEGGAEIQIGSWTSQIN